MIKALDVGTSYSIAHNHLYSAYKSTTHTSLRQTQTDMSYSRITHKGSWGEQNNATNKFKKRSPRDPP